jgi:hypothetical protein
MASAEPGKPGRRDRSGSTPRPGSPLRSSGGSRKTPPRPPLGGRCGASARSGTSWPRAGVGAWREASACGSSWTRRRYLHSL